MEKINQFVTVNKSEKKIFNQYLLGTFSKNKRAVPFRTYNPNSKNERVVFKLIEDPQKMPLGLLLSLRLPLLTLILAPYFVWLSQNYSHAEFRGTFKIFGSLMSLVCFHFSIFMANDYLDHLKGGDRLSSRSGSRMIQRGWLSAWQIKWFAMFFFALSLLLGAYTLSHNWVALALIVGIILCLFLFRYLVGKNFIKYGMGEFTSFLLLGPLMVWVADKSFNTHSGTEVYLFSLLLGILSTLSLQLKNLESIMSDTLLNKKSLISYLGFDRGKKIIIYEMILFLLLHFLLFIFLSSYITLTIYFVLNVFFIYYFLRKIKQSVSSLSSSMFRVGERMANYHIFYTIMTLTIISLEIL